MSKKLGIGKSSGSTGPTVGNQIGRVRMGYGSDLRSIDPAEAPVPTKKNLKTLAEWDKDDGKYEDFHRSIRFTNAPNAVEFDNWLDVVEGRLDNTYQKSHASMVLNLTSDQLVAIHNYAAGSGRYNIPLRNGNKDFWGSGGEDGVKWYLPSYVRGANYKILESSSWGFFGDVIDVSKKQARNFERELSKAFKYELDRGIIVSRGVEMHPLPQVGQFTQNKGYTSTAYDGKDWASGPEDLPIRYIIRIPRGSRVLHMSGKIGKSRSYLGPYHDEESEILLRKNAVFKTTKIEKSGGKINVYQDFLGYGSIKKMSKRKLKG